MQFTMKHPLVPTIRYMDKIGELCSKNGVFFVADAVSILGGDELPVDKWNIDICVTASQKALAASTWDITYFNQ